MSSASARQAQTQYDDVLQQYEAAMKFFAQQKFDKARPLLEALSASPVREIADRARLHCNTCQQRLQAKRPSFGSAEEYYDAAVVQMNQARYDEADEYLQKAVKLAGKQAHVEYAFASLYALRNEVESSLVHLEEALKLDPSFRVLARTDDDFRIIEEDPRFTELLYPEK